MKLASIQKIVSLNPIPGADRIEVATVLGWQVVVKKGEFKVGDLIAYVQIDTVMPDNGCYEFLRKRDFRVRTIKLQKQISQGLIIGIETEGYKEGDDITNHLGVKKYQKPEPLYVAPKRPNKRYKKYWWFIKNHILVRLFPSMKGLNSRPFPTNLVPMTDEERIQNIPQVLEQYRGKWFIASEKLDGSSITIILQKNWLGRYKVRICSRTKERVVKDTNFERHIKELARWYNTPNIIVQGEYIGKPQGNKYRLEKNEIRLFNIFVDGKRLDQNEFYKTCQRLRIPTCPLVTRMHLVFCLDDILKFAEGPSQLADTEREGLVFRCVENPTVSFKAISNKFLINNNE